MATISAIRFRNFRSLRDTEIPLRNKTILVGANNVGKTAVLEALDRAFAVGRRGYGYTERDVTVGVDPSAEGFEILVTIVPDSGDDFTDAEIHAFGTHIDLNDKQHRLLIQIRGQTDPEDGQFRTRLHFVKGDMEDDGLVGPAAREMLGFTLLPALREARREFSERSGLWARLSSLEEVTPEVAERVAHLGQRVGAAVVATLLGPDMRKSVDDSVTGLVSDVLYAGQPGAALTFSVTPIDPSEVLRDVELRLTTPGQTDARRIAEHSAGTQSVAMFGLFSAYSTAVSGRTIALGIEEPESHLHPHATRAMVRAVQQLTTQTILTTHSTAVTDAADPRSVVLLRRRGDRTVASAVPSNLLTDQEVKDIHRRTQETGTDFLFARAVLFTEGASERLAVPLFAAQMGFDWDVLGVSLVPVAGSDFAAFLKLLGPQGLDLPHFVACDLDAAEQLMDALSDLGRLPGEVNRADPASARTSMAKLGFHWWTAGNFEDLLLADGYATLYVEAFATLCGPSFLRNFAAGSKTNFPNPIDIDFLKKVLSSNRQKVSKPRLAQLVAELAPARGMKPPAELVSLLEQVRSAALTEAAAVAGQPAGPANP
jgi:putative ATP-dependent endonuclease of the OLD family